MSKFKLVLGDSLIFQRIDNFGYLKKSETKN